MAAGREIEDADRLGERTVSIIGVVGFAVMLGAAVIAAAFVEPSVRAAGAQSPSGGELFAQHCASCHQATGLGIEGTFPPLVANPAAVDAAYVETVIREGLSGPLEVLGVEYDEEMPPAFALTDQAEISAVVQYVVALANQGSGDQTGDSAVGDLGEETGAEGEAAGPVVGDRDRGHGLFIGGDRFDNGGAACVGCHTAGSVGNLGGWSLGPDLTDSYETLGGEVGLTAWLSNPPSPTMQPIFADRELSEAERADLAAFLDHASREDKADTGFDRLIAAGVVGLVVLIAGMAVAWRGMRQTYVEHLRNNGRRRPNALVGAQRRSNRSLPGTRPAQAERKAR